MTDEELGALFSCELIALAHGCVAFRHERFEHFLAAESLVTEVAEVERLARLLNEPRCARLRDDAVALEHEAGRLLAIISRCEHSDLLFAAATGRLGSRAAAAAETLLADALADACAQTAKGGATFDVGPDGAFGGQWNLPSDPAAKAQLTAIGRLLAHGRFLDGSVRLLDLTDALCARLLQGPPASSPVLANQMFAATYALGGRNALPATALVRGAVDETMFTRECPETADVARELMNERDEAALGRLYLAAEFMHRGPSSMILAEVITESLKARHYHLRLLGLQLAHGRGRGLAGSERRRVLEAIHALPTGNIAISSSIVETLSALDDLEPVRDLDDITEEIRVVLGMRDDPLAQKAAYGIISSQFETEAIGPYYEAVTALDDADRRELLVMALDGGQRDSMAIGWVLGEIKDLNDPSTRSAVERHVARADPSSWFSAQEGMDAVVRALRLLAAEEIPLPAPSTQAANSAWRAAMALVLSAVSAAENPALVEQAWSVLLDEHPEVVASLLLNLRQMWGLHATGLENPRDVHDRLLARMPDAGISVLVWSLEHPDRVRSLPRYDHDRGRYLIGLLGRIGDRRACEALRRLIDDPDVGEAAAAAVRAIELCHGVAATVPTD